MTRLQGSAAILAKAYDVALLDLDGVVYRGRQPVEHAGPALAEAREFGMRLAFVTNNALRPPIEVAQRIRDAGVEAEPDDVVTSAQAAARVLAERVPVGSNVLVAGGAGLREAVAARGLVPVVSADDHPAAVVCGYDPEITYARLAEAVVAIFNGALWVASNTDTTVPTERGLLPGAGALVAFIAAATKVQPLVAGKPEIALHEEATARSQARRPLVVGDRLDTDIEGANRASAPSLLVFTGVATLGEMLTAGPEHRPTYLGFDLRALLRSAPDVTVDAEGATARCGAWTCRLVDGRMSWSASTGEHDRSDDDGLDAYRAGISLYWQLADGGSAPQAHDADLPPACEVFARTRG